MFARDNITEDDILVVDVGGNDVALHPTCGVIFNIILLLYLTPTCLSFGHPWSSCWMNSVFLLYVCCVVSSRFPDFRFPKSQIISQKKNTNKTKNTYLYLYIWYMICLCQLYLFFFLVGFSGCGGIIRCCPWLAPGMWYFIYMFRVRLRRLVQKLIAKRKPKKVVICALEGWDMWKNTH